MHMQITNNQLHIKLFAQTVDLVIQMMYTQNVKCLCKQFTLFSIDIKSIYTVFAYQYRTGVRLSVSKCLANSLALTVRLAVEGLLTG